MKKGNNPALRESAKKFNDSLLGAQKKKIDALLKVIEERNNDIEKLAKERNTLQFECDSMREASKLDSNKIARMGKEISRLNGIIHKKNMEIGEKRKGCVNVFNENQDLEKLIKDKNAVLSDVAEELRLSKVREENLTEVCQKYLKEIGELRTDLDESEKCKNQAYKSCQEKNELIAGLRKKLANIIVNNVDAQALKSAESALAYKEKVIDRLKKKFAERKKPYAISISHPEIIIPHNDFMEILRLW